MVSILVEADVKVNMNGTVSDRSIDELLAMGRIARTNLTSVMSSGWDDLKYGYTVIIQPDLSGMVTSARDKNKSTAFKLIELATTHYLDIPK